MKTRLSTSFRFLYVWCLLVAGTSGFGQAPVIGSFSQTGELVCTDLEPGSLASVEWAPSFNGPWTNSWAGLDAVTVGSNGAIRAGVPMYYRVRVGSGISAPTDGSSDRLRAVTTNTTVMVAYKANGELVCADMEPGTVAVVEWASSLWGPWTNSWAGLESVVADGNGAIRVMVPMVCRVRGVPRDPGQTNLAWIPAGTFTMGSPYSESARFSYEGPQTQVTISRGFWMGKYEVTQGEYLAVMGSNPSYFRNGTTPYSGGAGGAVTNELRHPVETVSWYEATNYCGRLTAQEQAAGRLPAGYAYRLATEAEWEYACRAGTTTAFHYGSALRSGMANFDGRYEYPPCGIDTYYCYNSIGTYLGRTTSVGSYGANAWGLYDLHGSVWEWCQDWWDWTLLGGRVFDPQGPPTGSYRVIRGGGWGDDAYGCRSAFRYFISPTYRGGSIGFRVVLAFL